VLYAVVDSDSNASTVDHNAGAFVATTSQSTALQPREQPEPSHSGQTKFIDDLGKLITATMSVGEISKCVSELSNELKYHLLRSRTLVPPSQYEFPTQYLAGCNRAFKRSWLVEFPWLSYSEHLDGAYCMPCALFVQNRSSLGILVNRPFTKWHKKTETLTSHAKCGYHITSLEAASSFLQAMENPQATIPPTFDSRKAANIQRNRVIVQCITESVLFCGRQCIGLRGDGENQESGNTGNFRAALDLIAQHEPILKEHLQDSVMRNCKYTSPVVQNEIIEIIGQDIIKKKIVSEIREANFFSILADEVTSHNVEELALIIIIIIARQFLTRRNTREVCIRFVDRQQNIREEFVNFMRIPRITGDVIASTLLREMEDMGLDLSYLVGQGYDGAANMSSERVGVQGRIKREAPLATYTHCSGHALNLVIAHSSSMPGVRNVIDRIKHICMFFNFSPKRNGLLVDVIQTSNVKMAGKKPLLDVCRTRWAERHDAYTHFHNAYPFLVQAFEVMIFGQSCPVQCDADFRTG